jgi:hypothetical protein
MAIRGSIATSSYRYKRPPRKRAKATATIEVPAIVTVPRPPKRKAVALEVPTVVVPAKTGRRRNQDQAAAQLREENATHSGGVGGEQPSTAEALTADHKPAILTIRKRRAAAFGNAPDMTPEEHKRRGDAADELFRQIVRRATGKQ